MRSARIAAVQRTASQQLGLITTQQMTVLGLTRRHIQGLVATGVIVRVYRSVFRLPGAMQTLQHRALAACLAAGADAVTSDTTAAELWRLVDPKDGPIHLTVRRGRGTGYAGIDVHRRNLGPHEVTRLGPIPITRVARTIADLRGAQRERALDEALRRGIASPDQLTGYDRSLERLVMDRTGNGVPESELERRAIELLRRRRLPEPIRQFAIGAHRVDLAYPDRLLAIELDGRAHHWRRDRWEADLARQNALELRGWRVLRFTWWDITERPDEVVDQIRTALGLRPARSRAR
jgi:very-short-patch-repair endonuclease